MDRGSQLDEEDEEEAGKAEGRRSGRQEEEEERKAADIKSNNPHLAGGELSVLLKFVCCRFAFGFSGPPLVSSLFLRAETKREFVMAPTNMHAPYRL